MGKSKQSKSEVVTLPADRADVDTPEKWTVFYSWQSDIPRERGQNLVRHALREAAIEVEARLGDRVRVEVDEATRSLPGSPDILTSLLEKISTADVFVGDLTIVGSVGARTYPNPNVLFETAYACALLGWPRTIMVANESYGDLKALPFDLPRRRVAPFKCAPKVSDEKADVAALASAKGQLRVILTNAILEVIKSAPRKPVVPVVDESNTRRQRDIATLRKFLVALNPDIIDELSEVAPARLPMRMFTFWDSFDSLFTAASTHVNDAVARGLLSEVHKHWSGVVSHGGQYMPGLGDFYAWVLPNDLHPSKASEKEFRAALKSLKGLHSAQAQLRAHIRDKYVELDEQELRAESWRQYQRAIEG